MTDGGTRTAAIYTRVSDKKQLKGNGLHDQLKACQKYAAQNAFTVVDEIVEAGYTGKALKRPEFERLKAQAGKVDAVIFYLQDRMSRGDELETIDLMRFFEDRGTEVHTTNRGRIDTHNFGSLIMAFADAYQSREWREKHVERVRSSLHTNAEKGQICPTGGDRYGYRYIPKSQGGPSLVVDEVERETVEDIYTWFALGDETGQRLSMQGVVNKLSALGRPTVYDRTKRATCPADEPGKRGYKRKGPGVWSLSTVRQIIRNPLYKGEAVFGRTRVEWYEDENGFTKNRQVPVLREDWTIVKVKAIISPELWELAQKQADLGRDRSPRRSGKGKFKSLFLLRRLMTCSHCGMYMHCDGSHGRTVYRCGGNKRPNTLDGQTLQCHGSINTAELDNRVWSAIKAFVLDPTRLLVGHKESQSKRNSKRNALKKRQQDALRQATETKQAQDILLEVRLSGRISREDYESRDDKLKAKLAERLAELATLEHELSEAELEGDTINSVFAYCQRMSQGIEHVTFEEKRAILEAFNITGVIQRGADRADDVLILTGNIIPLTVIPLPADGRRADSRFTVSWPLP